MNVVIKRFVKLVNIRILIVFNNGSFFLLNNLIKCYFGIREKVSLMIGKGFSVEGN